MKKKKSYHDCLPILYSVIICITLVTMSCNQAEEESENTALIPSDVSSPQTITTPVEVSPAFRGTLVQRITVSGRATANRTITIKPKISGTIAQLPIHEGMRVKKGDVLIQLDDEELRLSLEESQAQFMEATIAYGKILGERNLASTNISSGEGSFLSVEKAEKKLEELDSLIAEGNADNAELLWAQAEYEAAKIFSSSAKEPLLAYQSGLTQANLRLKRAQMALENTRILADFDGVIGNIEVNEGDLVSVGQTCFQLLDLSSVIINTGVIETEINAIAPGRRAQVSFPAVPDTVFEGSVISINPVVDVQSRTCNVEITVPNKNDLLKAGMFATAKIDAHIYDDLFLVPKLAILERDNRKLVFIVRDNLAKWCYVETGRENEEFVEVLSSAFNLTEGEPVITTGHYTLVHDAPVSIVPSDH